MGLVKSLYILAPQQQPHHLIFAKMKHIFQAHLFLLPIINSVRFDIVEQQCACNKGIFNVADNENQSLLFCQFPMGLQKAKFAFLCRLGYDTTQALRPTKTSNNTTKSYCLGKYGLMTLFAFFHREIKSGIGALASKIIK